MNINFSANNLNLEVSNEGDPMPLLNYAAEKYTFSIRLPELLVALNSIVKAITPQVEADPVYDFYKQAASNDGPNYKGNGEQPHDPTM